MPNKFRLFEMMDEYEMLAIEAKSDFYFGFNEVKREVEEIQKHYNQMIIRQTSCHIDPACSNFLKDRHGRIYLIDWEYGGMFDPLWDIAAFSLEAELSPMNEEELFTNYFGREITEQEKQRIFMHQIFQDYLWSLWTLFKEEKGDNFGLYGRRRFERAKKNIGLYKARYCLETTAQ